MNLLLPYRFKWIGAAALILGTFTWICTQQGGMAKLIPAIDTTPNLRVGVLAVSFFAALFGWYGIAFSKEKVEDELIKTLRLKAFQLSAIIQIVFFIGSFIYMFLFSSEPAGDGGLAIFLGLAILIFWITYITYFNGSIILLNLHQDDE